jgi:hypothetical protein
LAGEARVDFDVDEATVTSFAVNADRAVDLDNLRKTQKVVFLLPDRTCTNRHQNFPAITFNSQFQICSVDKNNDSLSV